MQTIIYLVFTLAVFSLPNVQGQESKASPSPSPTKSQQSQPDRIYTGKEVDVKAKLKRPFSEPPEPGRDCEESDIRLLAVLKVVLHKSGVVSDVTIMKGSGCSYDNEAVKVAHKLKFEPAEKDGQPVSQYLIVEYEYHKP
jgi:TonB family protein